MFDISSTHHLLQCTFDYLCRDEYLAPIPESEREDLISAYHKRLNSDDEDTRIKAATAWSKWEWVPLLLI